MWFYVVLFKTFTENHLKNFFMCVIQSFVSASHQFLCFFPIPSKWYSHNEYLEVLR